MGFGLTNLLSFIQIPCLFVNSNGEYKKWWRSFIPGIVTTHFFFYPTFIIGCDAMNIISTQVNQFVF